MAESNQAVFEVAGPAGIRAVADLHRRLLDALKSADAVAVDVRRAEDIDITLIQLIEAGRRHAAANNRTLTLAAPAGGELRDALDRGGFLERESDRTFWLANAETAR